MSNKFKISKMVKPTTIKELYLVEGIKAVLNTYKKGSINLSNTKHTSALYSSILNYICNNYCAGKFENVFQVKTALNNILHIESATQLGNILSKYAKKLKKAGFNMTAIKKEKLRKFKYVKGNKSHINMDLTRTVAIRSKYGTTEVMFYELHGAMCSNSNAELNVIKMSYGYDTGCNYYEARPILLSTWMNLPEWNKQATVQTEVI